MKLELVINLKTAKQIGVTILPNALARALGLKNQNLEVRKAEDFGRAFQAANKERAWAILVTANPLMFSNFGLIVDLAIKNRLPAIHSQREFVEAGGLMMYGPSEAGIYRRAAILRRQDSQRCQSRRVAGGTLGEVSTDLQLRSAKQIGLKIPANVLVRADRVIR